MIIWKGNLINKSFTKLSVHFNCSKIFKSNQEYKSFFPPKLKLLMILIMCLFSIDSACSFLPQDNLIIRRCDCIYFDWMIIREWGWSPCHHKVHTMFLTSTWLGCLGVVMDVICVVIDYSWIDVSIHTFISIMECQYWSYHWVTLAATIKTKRIFCMYYIL